MLRIAILDNNHDQNNVICTTLNAIGHACVIFSNDMLPQLHHEGADMVIVDWQMADASSKEILQWIRKQLPRQLPVLVMIDRNSEDDILASWAAGADDYMIKPLRRRELILRVQALLRRAYPVQSAEDCVQFGAYLFDRRCSRVKKSGNVIKLTQKEFMLALLFFQNLGRPISRAYILETVWACDADVSSRTVDTHVSRVRSKLQINPKNGLRLVPVYSYGYCLEQLSGPPSFPREFMTEAE